MTTAGSDTAAFVRGKLHMAGVDHFTPITTTCDVITVLAMDVPTEDLAKWRRELNHALWKVRPPDRSTWGLTGDQRTQMGRLAGMKPRMGAAAPRGAGRVAGQGGAQGQASRGTRGSPAPRSRP